MATASQFSLTDSLPKALFHLLILTFGSLEGLRHLTKVVVRQVLAQFREVPRQILRTARHVCDALIDLRRVDMVEDLGVSKALDRLRTVQLDLALAIVLDTIVSLLLRDLCQDERDSTLLVLEINVHVKRGKSSANRFFNFLIALH